MKYDIEAYLDGALQSSALAAFEKELANNAAFRAKVEQRRQLQQQLQKQLLREQVGAALADDPNNRGMGRWGWRALLGLTLLLALGAYFIFSDTSLPPTAAPASTPSTQSSAPTSPASPANEKAIEEKTNTDTPKPAKGESPKQQVPRESKKSTPPPIAQSNPDNDLAAPPFPSPNVRGGGTENSEWKKSLDAIWYTDFPPADHQFAEPFDRAAQLLEERNFTSAYVQLQRLERKIAPNDTLAFLKAYCLLELGEGTEAYRYFDPLPESLPEWKASIDWYRGLSLLIAGNRAEAKTAFTQIVAIPEHPYRLQSLKALALFQ